MLHRSSNKQATRWQKLCGRWSTAMEQSASRTASARHRTAGISTATENVFVYVRHRRLVTFVFERLITYSATTTTTTTTTNIMNTEINIKQLTYLHSTVCIKLHFVCVNSHVRSSPSTISGFLSQFNTCHYDHIFDE